MIVKLTAWFVAALALLMLSGQDALAQTRDSAAERAVPAAAAPPAGYVIGAEDVLGIVFWREAEMNGDVTVRSDGRITVPLVGELQAAGLTPEALRDRIQTAAEKFVAAPAVTVVVRQINSRKVFITGRVATPGAYPLVGSRTVMQIIALAGGLNEYADAKNVTILRNRNGRTQTFKFNYKDVSQGKKLEQNILLEPGDTIVVP